ncbi:MAG: N-acetylmuramoyl-L-alanine amidase [Bacteroidetes bacterium]|nr:N-acetylmuramoyl-L-alanine amidase [Bacteroidota bacterium]
MKRLTAIFGIISIFFLTSFNSFGFNKYGITKVVIDAGHGGHDPGCVTSKSKEKDVALSIALKLGGYIQKNFPEISVIYTRKTDEFIELYKRAQIANENKADLFISIHCNANPSSNPDGFETYVMGLNKSQANIDVSKKENSSILMEENYSAKYDGFDPNSSEANIIFSLYQNAHLDQSLSFASKVQNYMLQTGMTDRGVKQAGFLVLYKTTVPGVLIETGFLSNQKDEGIITSSLGQDLIASCIFNAFSEYKKEVEKGTTTVKYNNVVKQNEDVNQNNNENNNTNTNPSSDIATYRVQFATSPTKKSTNSSDFKGLQNVNVYFHKGSYKFTVGDEQSLSSANQLLSEMVKKGYKDAFVIGFYNGERISVEEAKKHQKK